MTHKIYSTATVWPGFATSRINNGSAPVLVAPQRTLSRTSRGAHVRRRCARAVGWGAGVAMMWARMPSSVNSDPLLDAASILCDEEVG